MSRAETPAMKGRVLFVTSSYPRWAGDGTSPFVHHLAVDLRRCGWSVEVLAPHAPGATLREVLEGVPVHRFRYQPLARWQTVCYRGGALANLRRSPSNWLKLPSLVVAEIVALAGRLSTRRYTLIHSHWILPQGFAASLLAPVLRVPHVATVHGSDVLALRGRLLVAFQRFVIARADAVTVNSSATRAAVEAIAPLASPPHLAPMGISFDPAVEPGQRATSGPPRASGPRVVYVGRLVAEKGVGDLIDAMVLLRRSIPGVSLELLGDGADRPAFEKRVQALGMGAQVHFAGMVSSSEVHAVLASADVCAAPSHVEGQGLTVLEAMAAGTPVVASFVGGITDVVRHEQTGLLVPPGAPDELAAALERLLLSPELSNAIRERAYELVRGVHTREAAAARFDGIYTQLVSSSPGPRRNT